MQTSENINTIGVYVKVSSKDPDHTSSYDSEISHYIEEIQKRPNWHLYKIYADEVKSRTSSKQRRAFKKMIRDCMNHKINLILTKNIYSFSSNLIDCISYIKMLSNLTPPIGILFEAEHIYTLEDNFEDFMKFLETLVYEEKASKRRAMEAVIRMRSNKMP